MVSASNTRVDVSFSAFFSTLKEVVAFKDVANGVFKSFCFAVIIGVVSCHQGLQTIGGPRGIGRSVATRFAGAGIAVVARARHFAAYRIQNSTLK